MDTEAVLSQILSAMEAILTAVVEGGDAAREPAMLYALEARVQALLPRIGQAVLQGLMDGQDSGAVGAERACACGALGLDMNAPCEYYWHATAIGSTWGPGQPLWR